MLGSIILLLFIIFLVYSLTQDEFTEGGRPFFILVFTVALVWNTLEWTVFRSYEYDLLVEDRKALQTTVDRVRESSNEYEVINLFNAVQDFNRDLAEEKVDNGTWAWDRYVDDRVMAIEPVQ